MNELDNALNSANSAANQASSSQTSPNQVNPEPQTVRKTKTPALNPDNLPLNVRECLMRGQQAGAVQILIDDYGFDKQSAENLIEDYRERLRERKLALEIRIMQEQNEKMQKENRQFILLWVLRIALISLFLSLIYVMSMTYR